jgi:integrase/recombinase XerD
MQMAMQVGLYLHYKPKQMASANLLLDKRSTDKYDRYPVRLQIYHMGNQFLVSTKLFATEETFNAAIKQGSKARNHSKLRDTLNEQRTKAQSILDKMGTVIDKDKFKRMFYSEIAYQTKGAALYIADLYAQQMAKFKKGNQFKHMAAYQSSLNSLNLFKPNLALQDITVELLEDYDHWMRGKGCSLSTVNTYLRPLRTVFKKAIDEGFMSADSFPFGRGKYVINNSESARMALHREEVRMFWDYAPANDAQQRAKDFWFFSYFANGMAPVDMAHLTAKNFKGDHIIYQRKKTQRTKRQTKDVIVHVNEDMQTILDRQGSADASPYLFTILSKGMTTEEQYKAVEEWKREQNKILQRIAVKLKLETLCLYSARHSYAGALGMEDVNLKTVADMMGQETSHMAANYMGNLRLDRVKQLSTLTSKFKD